MKTARSVDLVRLVHFSTPFNYANLVSERAFHSVWKDDFGGENLNSGSCVASAPRVEGGKEGRKKLLPRCFSKLLISGRHSCKSRETHTVTHTGRSAVPPLT